MPNIKSAKKRLRQMGPRTELNRGVRTRVKTTRRKFFEAIATGDKVVSEGIFRAYCSVLDRAAKKGVIKKNTAIRRKTRAAEKLRAIA